MENFRITRPARKHRVGNAFIIEALLNSGEPVVEGDARRYVGTDSRGVELEIVAIPDDKRPNGWAVIHAMPTQYRE